MRKWNFTYTTPTSNYFEEYVVEAFTESFAQKLFEDNIPTGIIVDVKMLGFYLNKVVA